MPASIIWAATFLAVIDGHAHEDGTSTSTPTELPSSCYCCRVSIAAERFSMPKLLHAKAPATAQGWWCVACHAEQLDKLAGWDSDGGGDGGKVQVRWQDDDDDDSDDDSQRKSYSSEEDDDPLPTVSKDDPFFGSGTSKSAPTNVTILGAASAVDLDPGAIAASFGAPESAPEYETVGDDVDDRPENDGRNGFSEFSVLCAKLGVPMVRYREHAGRLEPLTVELTDRRGKRVRLKPPKSLDDPYAARQLSMLAAMSPDAQVASTYTELRTAAQKCDLSNNQRRSIMPVLQGRGAAAPPRAPTAPRAPRDAARPARAPTASTATRKGTPKTPRTCYNCGKEGHISKDCPDPPTASTLAARAKKAAGSQ